MDRIGRTFFSVCGLMMITLCGLAHAAEGPGAPLDAPSNDASKAAVAEPGNTVGGESQPVETSSEKGVEEIVVTGTRSRESSFLSSRNVSTVTAKDIEERMPRTTPEALRETPGVFVQQTNPGGGSPIVRGLVGPQVLILMDGVRLNNSVYRTGPLQYLNFIDPLQIERLETLLGPNSMLYGSDAIGGTINAVMRTPVDRRDKDGFGWNIKAAGRYGSAMGEKLGHAAADLGYDNFGSLLTASYKDFDDLTGGKGVGTQRYTSYSQVNAGVKLQTLLDGDLTRDWRITAAYYMTHMFDVGRSEALETKHKANVYQNEDHLAYARAEMKFKPIFTDLTLTLSYQRFFEEKDDLKFDSANKVITGTSRSDVTVDTIGVDAMLATKVLDDRLVFQYGGEYYHDFIDSSAKSRKTGGEWTPAKVAPYPKGSEYRLGGAWILAKGEILPLSSDWDLSFSIGYRFQSMGGRTDAVGSIKGVDYGNQAHIVSAGFQTAYKRNWMLALNYSQGFRVPNAQESLLTGDTGDWFNVMNPDLGPERGDTIEALTRFDVWKFKGGVSGYATFLSDFIKRVPYEYEGQTKINNVSVVRNVNGGKARLYGTEAHLGIDIAYGLSVHGSISYVYGEEILDKEGQAKDEKHREKIPLSKIPPLFGDARLRWDSPNQGDIKGFIETYVLWAEAQKRLSDLDKDDIRIPKGGTPGWATWNVRAGLDLYRLARLTVTLENLTNAKYKYHASGVYAAGTNAVLGAEIHY